MIRRAFAYSFLQRYAELVIQLGSMIVIARLVAPEEFGVFVTGMVLLTLAWGVGEFGQRDYLIQDAKLAVERRAAALALSLIASAACAGLIITSLLLLPEHLSDGRLSSVLAVLALVLLVRPWTTGITALMQREMRFGPVCTIGVMEAVTSAAVAIGLTSQDFGAFGLACGVLAGALAGLVSALMIADASHLTVPRLRGWRHTIRFSLARTGVSSLTELGEAGSLLVVSQLLGYAAVGLIDRARRITGLFGRSLMEALRPAVLPVLALRSRSGGDLKAAYGFKVSCVGAIAWPFYGFVALFAAPIVAILLGPMWSEVVPLVRILCLIGLWAPVNYLNPRFYIALDMLPQLLRRQGILQPAKLLLVAGGCLISVELAIFAFVAASLLKVVLDLGPLKRRLDYGAAFLLQRSVLSGIVAAFSLLPTLGLTFVFGLPRSDDLGLLAIGLLVTALSWLAVIFIVRHPLADEARVLLAAGRMYLRPTDATAPSRAP